MAPPFSGRLCRPMTEEEVALARRLGNSLRRHRQERGWTQARLAEAAEVSINHVSYIERGERLPSVPMLVQFARALQVTTSELLGETLSDAWASRVLALSETLSEEAKEVVVGMLRGLVGVYQDNPLPVRRKKKTPKEP